MLPWQLDCHLSRPPLPGTGGSPPRPRRRVACDRPPASPSHEGHPASPRHRRGRRGHRLLRRLAHGPNAPLRRPAPSGRGILRPCPRRRWRSRPGRVTVTETSPVSTAGRNSNGSARRLAIPAPVVTTRTSASRIGLRKRIRKTLRKPASSLADPLPALQAHFRPAPQAHFLPAGRPGPPAPSPRAGAARHAENSGDQRDRHEVGDDLREDDRQREVREHGPDDPGQEDHGQEHHDRGHRGADVRAGHLPDSAHDRLLRHGFPGPGATLLWRFSRITTLLSIIMPMPSESPPMDMTLSSVLPRGGTAKRRSRSGRSRSG